MESEAAKLLEAGERSRAERSLDRALSAYKTALSEAPSDPDAALRIGSILLFKKRCAEALPIIERSGQLAFSVDLSIDKHLSSGDVAGNAKLRELVLLFGRCRLTQGADAAGFHALELLPDLDPDVRFLMGRRYLEVGNHNSALAHLSAYLDSNPKDLKVRKAVANLQLRLDRLADAATSYRQILDRSPDDLDALKHLAVVEARRERYPEAIRNFRKVLKRIPTDIQARFNLGVSLARVGKHDAAVGELKLVLKRKPRLARAWHRLGLSQGALGRDRESRFAFEKAIDHAPKNVSSYLELAKLHRRSGTAARCAAVLKRALRIDPKAWRVLLTRGDCLREQGDASGALAAHRRAAALAPREPAVHFAIGSDLEGLGRLEKAAAAYRSAREPAASSPRPAEVALARVLGQIGARAVKERRLDAATTALSEAVQLQPKVASVRANLGLAYLSAGKVKKATDHLSRAHQVDSTHVGVKAALARALLEQDKASRAIALLASIRRPGVRVRQLLGLSYLRSGKADEAVPHLQAALQGVPGDSSIRYALGKALLLSRRFDQGQMVFSRFADEAPAGVDADALRLMRGYAAFRGQNYVVASEDLGALHSKQKAIKELQAAALSGHALLLAQSGDLDSALVAFKRAAKIKNSTAAKTNLAAVMYRRGKARRAYRTWRALARRRAPAEVLYNIGIYYDDVVDNERLAYRWYRKYARKLPSGERQDAVALLSRKERLFGFKP